MSDLSVVHGITTYEQTVSFMTGNGVITALSAMSDAHYQAALNAVLQTHKSKNYVPGVKDCVVHLQAAHDDLRRTWKRLDSFVMKSVLRYTALFAIHNDRYTCFLLGYCYIFLKDRSNAQTCVDYLTQTDQTVSSLENRFSFPFTMFIDPSFYNIFRGKAPEPITGQDASNLRDCIQTMPR